MLHFPRRFAGGRVVAPTVEREYPDPDDYDFADPFYESELYSLGPWMVPRCLEDEALIQLYVIADRLPGGLHVNALYSED